MPERIYTSAGDGKLEALEETPFPTEDELQALIAEHPQLLDGAQIRPGDARRWFLVTREKGIAASAGAAARWAVDHVIIDQDAVPTPAEVQCSSNPEIRRTIVGQLLEYAAYASETWTAEELRGAFERHAEARGRLRKPSLRPCCKRMETPMWTGSGRTHPTRRLTSPWVAARILRGGFEALRRFIAFFVSGWTLIAFRLRPQVGDMREAPDIEFRVAEPLARVARQRRRATWFARCDNSARAGLINPANSRSTQSQSFGVTRTPHTFSSRHSGAPASTRRA